MGKNGLYGELKFAKDCWKTTLSSKNENILKSGESGHFDDFTQGLMRQNGKKWLIWRVKFWVQKDVQNQVI